jgi:putative transcriptional regulator
VDLQTLVAQYLECGISALPWRSAGRGLAIAKLRATRDERLWLLRAAAGTVLPRHTHSGSELTLVLKGAFFNRDRIYAAGDMEDADETTDHQPVVTNEGECLCLAVTEGPLRFRALLPRLAQSYLGI